LNSPYKIALHIGLPKTATTSLQKNVLNQAHMEGRLNFLGRCGEIFESDYFFPIESIFAKLDNNSMSDEQVSILRKELLKYLREDILNVISEESLSLTHGFHYVRLENLKRILSVFEVKTFVSLRAPIDFFYSYYIELFPTTFVRCEKLDTLDKFASEVINDPSNKDFDIVRFDRILFHINTLFSELHIILFEDLKQDKEEYIASVANFFELDQEFVRGYFFSGELNKGMRSLGGKYSRDVSLLEKFQEIKGSLIGRTRLYRLKKYKTIYALYKKLLMLLKNTSFSEAVDHEPLAEDKLKYLKSCLYMKKAWAEEIGIDAHKLELYGYTESKKQNDCRDPLVSFCLMTYNHEKYIENALNAALNQTYSNMEVVVSDDDSSDKTVERIKENLKVPSFSHVKLRPQTTNLGINAHVNSISRLSSGSLTIIASGDDVSMPNRVERLVERWQEGAVGIFSNAEVIDSEGRRKSLFVQKGYKPLTTWKEMINAGSHGAWGSTFAWDRKICKIFGSLPTNILGEDAIIPFRCALLGKVEYIDEPLVQYRDHGENVSFWAQRKKISGKSLRRLGEEVMQFDLAMYQNWRKDIQTAFFAGYLTKEDVEWAESGLCLHEAIHEDQLKVLQASYGRAILVLLDILRSQRTSPHRGVWFRRVLGIFLHYRMPILFKFVHFFRRL